MEENIDDLFNEGIELRDGGRLVQSAQIFLKIIQNYPNDRKLGGTCEVLAGIYFDLQDFNNSLAYFTKATQLKPHSELASLGVYLSYVKLNDYGEAIKELKRYLDVYPANLYRDTLKELLEDLKNGYATSFKDTIIFFAKKNGLTSA